jgi:hypothetical protein
LGLGPADQAQVGLVDQGGGGKSLPGGLARQPGRGEPAQLVVDQGQHLLGGVGVALLDGGQDAGNLTHRRHHKAGRAPRIVLAQARFSRFVVNHDHHQRPAIRRALAETVLTHGGPAFGQNRPTMKLHRAIWESIVGVAQRQRGFLVRGASLEPTEAARMADVLEAAIPEMLPGAPWPLCAFAEGEDEEAMDALVEVIGFLRAGRRVIIAERPTV